MDWGLGGDPRQAARTVLSLFPSPVHCGLSFSIHFLCFRSPGVGERHLMRAEGGGRGCCYESLTPKQHGRLSANAKTSINILFVRGTQRVHQ